MVTTNQRSKIHTVYKNRDGERVPSVTTIIGLLDKPALLRWAWECGKAGIDYMKERDQAAGVGTLAHYLCECDIKGEKTDGAYLAEFSPTDVNKAENAFLAFLDWRKTTKANLKWSEAVMVSERKKFGGTVDCIGDIEGHRTLIDFKTSGGIYSDYTIQVAAYENLWNECYPSEEIDDVIILRLGKEDGAFEVKSIPLMQRLKAWELFEHLREIYDLKKEIR